MSHNVNPKPKACPSCGREFVPTSNRQRYCPECGRRGFGVCLVCGKRFQKTANTGGLYCSRECWYKANSNTDTARRACEVCGKEFKPHMVGQRTCGRACGNALRAKGKDKTCVVCGKTFTTRHTAQTTCSKACMGILRRTSPPLFCERCGKPIPYGHNPHQRFCSEVCRRVPIGTTKPSSGGYLRVYVGHDYPNADRLGYMLEHRHIMSQHLGRPLTPSEHVHHKNGDRTDNRLENLELWQGKDPPGQRQRDLIQSVLADSRLASLTAEQRTALADVLSVWRR